jgi:pimeloyl-ACP methyl ester carboxylesterase
VIPAADDVYLRFVGATLAQQLRMVSDPETATALRARIGAGAVEEYLRLARRVRGARGVLGDRPVNLIVIPGVMGSLLVSRGLGGMWWIDLRQLNRLDSLGLDPEGERDATPGADLWPAGLDASYAAFLAAAYDRDDIGHGTYAYDWRRPVVSVASGLRDAVLSAHAANGGEPVHLAAHSMGGLVIRTTLMRYPDLWDKVGRIVYLGTPHYGSPAIAAYLKNHLQGFNLLAVLGRFLKPATLRSLWGVLSLLPAPAGVYPGTRPQDGASADPAAHPCANFDLYDAAAYRLGLDPAAQARLQRILDAAASLHRQLRQWHVELPQERRDRMAVIAGVGYRTLFRVAYQPKFGFAWQHMDRVTSRRSGDVHREGDGRVPLASAELEHIGETRYLKGEHGKLPSIPAAWSDAFGWLTGGRLSLPRTPQAALAARLDSETPVLAAATGPSEGPEDPGYLDFSPPDEATLVSIEQELAAGGLPEFVRVRLL